MSACQAWVPVRDTARGIAFCGPGEPMDGVTCCAAPATANYTYRCACGAHLINRSSCPAHEPAPGQVGCFKCRTELGHDCDLEVQA